MGTNEKLARLFLEMALFTEYLGEGDYKARAYRRAHDLFMNLALDAREIYRREGIGGFLSLEGVGEAIAKKTVEFLETGKIAKHQELASRIPPGIRELLLLKGVGAKTLRKIVDTLGIEDRDGLMRAIETGQILRVPGVGKAKAKALKRAILEARERGESC